MRTPAEERDEAWGEAWFAALRAVPDAPFLTWHEPEVPAPLDLTTAAGIFTPSTGTSYRQCRNCRRGIMRGWPRVSHRLSAESAVTHHYHAACVVLPKGDADDAHA